MKKLLKCGLVLVAGIILFTGCAGTQKITATTPIQDLGGPEWVTKGGASYTGEAGKRVFYGVGVSEYKSITIRRSAADNAARSDLAKTLKVYISSLEKNYVAETAGGDLNTAEAQFEGVSKTVVAMTLSGVQIVDHWQNPANGVLYALARLDLDSFKDNVKRVKELDNKVKEYIQQNADRLHDELREEEGKVLGR